jgi:SAM-dependent methyltransferase
MTSSPSVADQYDGLPYEGHPDPVIHPDRMAAAAWLHGVSARPPAEARILEIGCATGAHLIPMAYELPGAVCVGFDCSSRQIDMGRAFAASVGVKNLRLEVRDIQQDHSDLGDFDYILAHGVFSWVPRETQDALLGLCQRHLAPAGVALIDYNVYPGWHMRELLRSLVSFHKTTRADLPALTGEALRSLEFISQHLFAPASPYGHMASHLYRWACDQPKNYLAHEFGSSQGNPILFSEFAERTNQAGLQILGDAQLTHVIPSSMAQVVQAHLDAVAGDDVVRREQFLDFLRGREFRRTLLVRNDAAVCRKLVPNAMHRLHLTTLARREAASQGAIFRCPDGAVLQTINTSLVRALTALCDIGPIGMSFDEAFRTGCPEGSASVDGFAETLLEAVSGGIVQLHTFAPKVTGHITDRPVANPLARASAHAGNDVVTSILHRDWRVDHFDRRLISLLDGTRPRETLAAAMQSHEGMGDRSTSMETLQQIESRIAASLQWFARVGIFIG